MSGKNLAMPVIALGLILTITACEKPEEPLTPPAALESKTPAATQAVASDEAASPSTTDSEGIANNEGPLEFEVIIEDGEQTDESAALEAPVVDVVEEPVEALAETAENDDEYEAEPTSEEAEASVEAASKPETPEPPPVAKAQPRTLFPPELISNKSAHICFFSFNTGVEYIQLRRMVNQLNKVSNANLTVSEYALHDADPYDSFVALLNSGKQCDGVVLSGHHTDEFYGDRTSGDLEIDDLEELACDPKHSAWFANVKALWLQGCNTVKAGVKNDEVDEDEVINGSPIAQLQNLMELDEIEESVEDMQDLLEENINEENLVNDYMRVFSGATVYGWSNIAPGEQAGAKKSIPYHLAQVTRLVDKSPQYFQNPLQTQIPPVAAERYSEVLYGLLKRPNRPDGSFPSKLSEKNLMQGWLNHGNFRYKYSFDNPDIETFVALGNSNNEILKQLKGLNCLMHQLEDDIDDMNYLEVADYILRDRNLTTYNSYLLWAMLRSLDKGSAEYTQLRQRLANDKHLVNELRFSSTHAGYSQKDAKAFLAALGSPERKVAKKKPAPAAKKEKPAAGKQTSSEAPAPAATQPAPAKKDEKPWYLNEGQDEAANEKEHSFDVKTDSQS